MGNTMEMEAMNSIGLKKDKAKVLAGKLNELLADYSIFYQNTRGFHWNIKGDKFFELHVKFEELYNDLMIKVDEVAERILTLGYTPHHNYSRYSEISDIKESKKVSEGRESVEQILSALKIVIGKQREILVLSADAKDEGTTAMMSDYIREQEKEIWMYSSYLKN